MADTKHSIVRAAGIVGFFSLLSKIVAIIMKSVLAAKLGAGDTVDVFNAAFRLPDFFFGLLILGTLSVAFVPVFVEYYIKDREEANKIANTILGIAFIGMGAVMLVLYFFVPQLVHILAPGFHGEKLRETQELTKLFLISPVIFTVSSVFYSVLNGLKRFLLVSIAPVLYNLGIIFGIIYLYPHFGLRGLGYGVLLGAGAHLLLQAWGAIHAGFRFRPSFAWNHPGVRKIAKLFLPRIFGLDIGQFSLIIATVIGSGLASGSIANFGYAYDLQFGFVGVIAVAFAIAAFPTLSESYATKDPETFNRTLLKSMCNVLFFIIPISVLLILLRAQIVRVVYGHGSFDFTATKLVANSVGIFAISMFSQSLSPLFSRSFFARHNTLTPMLVGFGTMILNVLASLYLSRQFGVLGLAGGFVIASICDSIVMFVLLRAQLKNLDDTYLLYRVLKICFASLLMAIVTYFSLYAVASVVKLDTTLNVFIQGFVAGILGICVFVAVAWFLDLEQPKFIWGKLRERLHI